MRAILLFLLPAVLAAAPLRGAATAYQTLQYLVQERGDGVLKGVMLIKGEGGAPFPEDWHLFRGGPNSAVFQTVAVSGRGNIINGRSAAREAGLPPHAEPINFSILNVDSNSAFRIATREAKREHFDFDHIDYRLQTNTLAGVPAWTMTMYNPAKGYLATLTISGTNGVVLRPLAIHSYVVEVINGQPEVVRTQESFYRRAMRSVGRWFCQTGSTFGKDIVKSLRTSEEIYIGNSRQDEAPDDD